MDFLEDYHIYTEPLETPALFNLWSALSALSAVAQRKIWFDGGMIKVCPNLYVVTVAPAGEVGKSVGMGIVQEHLLSKIKSVKVNSDSITKEKIFEEMANGIQQFPFKPPIPMGRTQMTVMMHCSYTLFANEMSVLIKDDRAFVAAMTSLYDAKDIFKHSTRHKGVLFLSYPYLNLYGCTTPDWISFNVHEDILEGGLTARTILLFGNKVSKRNPFPQVTQAMLNAYERMIIRLEQICLMGGPFTMTAAAKADYEKWYHFHFSKEPENSKMRGYHNRKRIHVVKVAMLLSLARNNSLIIDTADFDEALLILANTEPAIESEIVSRTVPITMSLIWDFSTS